jgi:hypothetical protein
MMFVFYLVIRGLKNADVAVCPWGGLTEIIANELMISKSFTEYAIKKRCVIRYTSGMGV